MELEVEEQGLFDFKFRQIYKSIYQSNSLEKIQCGST